MNIARGLLILGVGILVLGSLSYAVVTPFIDIDMGTVEAGKPAIVHGPGGNGLLLFNKENQPIRVRVEVSGLPDSTWVQIDPVNVVIAPRDRIVCRMIVMVPDRKEFRRRRYRALIRTRIQSTTPVQMGVEGALQSWLRFEVP